MGFRLCSLTAAACVGLSLVSGGLRAEPLFFYDWESSNPFTKVDALELNYECEMQVNTGANWNLFSDGAHFRSPTRAGRAERNYKACYYSQYDLPENFESGLYASVWVFEDNEHNKPNMGIELRDAFGSEAAILGIITPDVPGVNPENPNNYQNPNFTAVYKSLFGTDTFNIDPNIKRRQGWRQYTIRINGASNSPGDIQFFIDNQKVAEAARYIPFGFNQMRVGSGLYSYTFYWYDDILVDTWTDVDSIADAITKEPGTSIQIPGSVVTAWMPPVKGPKPSPEYNSFVNEPRGQFWVQDPNQPGVGLKILSATAVNPGDEVRALGQITEKNGQRVLEAATVEIVSTNNPDPAPALFIQNRIADTGAGLKPAVLVETSGKLMVKGTGYIVIDDGSNLRTAEGATGLKVYTTAGDSYQIGDFLTVKGVVDAQAVGGNPYPVLISRYASDISKKD